LAYADDLVLLAKNEKSNEKAEKIPRQKLAAERREIENVVFQERRKKKSKMDVEGEKG